MDKIPVDIYLKYNADTMMYMRKLYNLDKPGQMDEAIDLLDAWVQKQTHFVKKNYSREYLERVIVLLKGSIERAKGQLEKISTLRTLLPHYFEKYDVKNDLRVIRNHHTSALLPKLTDDHQRIYVMKLEPESFSPKVLLQIYFYNVIVCEYLKSHDYSDGLIAIVDFRKITSILEFSTQINLFELRQIASIILDGFAARTKKIILISTSNAIEIIVKILKKILSEKLGKRLIVVRDLDGLSEHVSRAVLPSDYGGEEKPLNTLRDEFVEVLSSKENIAYLKDMSKARTNESLRTSSKINDDLLGLAGSFRTLSFD